MRKQQGKLFLAAVLLTAMCAHKAPPISKDRLSPRLSKVSVINTRQVQLTFSEAVDTVALTPDNVLIASATETLEVLLLYPSLSPSEIIVVTEPMQEIPYEISGRVLDKAGNEGLFTSRIQGSSVPDTIAPWVVQYSEGKSKNDFQVRFSEAMDTTWLSFTILPRKKFIPQWLDHRSVSFLPAAETESLALDTTYYLYLRNARDLSGNSAKPFITSVTPDTAYAPVPLRGRALLDDAPVASGIALLMRQGAVGIASVTSGDFAFMVRDSLPYDIVVISNGHSGTGRVNAASDNIIRLKKERLDIDPFIN
ncbi:hypothetical protein IBX73_05555 [candidate division WOR-3 bacterium]|nr:hypothetical protein [candidate division WOR-3 bacterium]